jgi:hypothetical protein
VYEQQRMNLFPGGLKMTLPSVPCIRGYSNPQEAAAAKMLLKEAGIESDVRFDNWYRCYQLFIHYSVFTEATDILCKWDGRPPVDPDPPDRARA